MKEENPDIEEAAEIEDIEGMSGTIVIEKEEQTAEAVSEQETIKRRLDYMRYEIENTSI